MSEDQRRAADARLAAAFEEAGVADRREDYRNWLRSLKRDDASAFREAAEHYERVVQPRLLESSDPVGAWIEFGTMLAGMSGPGRTVSVDRTGRSEEWGGEYSAGQLLLYLPEDRQKEAMPIAVPRAASPAQVATIDLLVLKKLSL